MKRLATNKRLQRNEVNNTDSPQFITVDATIGNQAFSHDGCNIFPGLSYNKANNTFLNSLGKSDIEAQLLNLR